MNNTDNEKERVVLLGIDCDSSNEAELSIDELERLANTAGAETVGKILQKRSAPHPTTYIGQGKLKELSEFCRNNDVDTVITDDELSGSQTKALEDALDVKVIDRTTLILDIFASRARSSEGRLQIELAQLQYRLPRLSGMGKALSRLGGGIGTRGPGESKLETDRRHIRKRITSIKQQLNEVSERRKLTRKLRAKNNLGSCALVGYTNAGKSTLLNALCGSDVYAEDELFATLDTTARKMDFSDTDISVSEIIMIDTVGFIRKLPHLLVESFKSTLEESMTADLLIHVVDISDPEAPCHIDIVENILSELGAADKPCYLVFNKCDNFQFDGQYLPAIIPEQLRAKKPNVFTVSAKTGEGLDQLKASIAENFGKERMYDLLIPYAYGKWVNYIYSCSNVLFSEHRDDGTFMSIKAKFTPETITKIEKFII